MDNRGLAAEAAQPLAGTRGFHAITRRVGEVKITDITISEEAKARVGRAAGRYITLEGEPHAQGLSALLQRAMTQILPQSGRLLAVGLGNPDITHDRLGAQVVRSLAARTGRRYSLCAVETDVTARTGIDSARLVRAAARELRADCVIAFDALSCTDPRRIGKTVQVTDAGLIPGSGAGRSRLALTRQSLGVPVVAVGVPTITTLSSITADQDDSLFHITTADIDVLVKLWGETLAAAVDLLVG